MCGFGTSVSFSRGFCRRSVENDGTRMTVLTERKVLATRRGSRVRTNLSKVLTSMESNGLRVASRCRSVRDFMRTGLVSEVNSTNGGLRAKEDHGSRMTLSVGLCMESRVSRASRLMGGLLRTLRGVVRRGIRACVPNFARLRGTRPIALTRRMNTCFRVFMHSEDELTSVHGEVGAYPLNTNTLTKAACPLSERCATRLLNFSNPAEGDVSSMSSESCIVRLLSTFSAVVVRVDHFYRRVVV